MNKKMDAASDFQFPPRSKQAIDALVDLSDFYTSSLMDTWTGDPILSMSSFPVGVHAYHRAAYDVRGLIQLAGVHTKKTGFDYPTEIKGIPVNHIADKIDFLHGAVGKAAEGTIIGIYTLHYENGSTYDIPIEYGRDVRDMLQLDGVGQLISANTIDAGSGISLYGYTVNNPLKDQLITYVDFTSKISESAPFLVAMTMEVFRTCMEHEWFDSIRIYNEIVPRDPKANDSLIDLSHNFMASPDDDWFNHAGHDLHDLPRGVQTFAGVDFDVRGLMVLAGGKTSLKITGLALPEEYYGIAIHKKGNTVNFLQACAFDSPIGKKLHGCFVNYPNGEKETILVLYGVNVMDWWERKEEGTVTGAIAAWYGSNAASRRFGLRTRVIMYSWNNPHPDWEIVSLDWVSSLENSAPMLFAITVK